MDYYGAKELAESFRTVRKNTLIAAEEIGEEYYGFRATPETRTIAQTLVHIAHICELSEQVHKVERLRSLENFDFMAFIGPRIADEQKPRTKAQILELLREGRDRFGNWLESLSDEFLGERVAMRPGLPGPASKTRFEMLLGVKEHEMHHRAQIMLLQRMTGGVPHLTREMQARFAGATAAPR